MGTQWDRPMKFNEWWAIRSQALRDLELMPSEWFRLFAGTNIDTGGTPQLMLDTSGRVTEASAAATLVSSDGILARCGDITAGWAPLTYPSTLYAAHRVYIVNIPIAAGGAVTNVPLHATLAGYKFHFKVLGMWSSVADVTTTWWFHTTAGAVSCTGCPPTPGFNVTALAAADTLYTPLDGCYMANPAVTGDVTLLDVAGVAAGAANLYIFLEGWFEPT